MKVSALSKRTKNRGFILSSQVNLQFPLDKAEIMAGRQGAGSATLAKGGVGTGQRERTLPRGKGMKEHSLLGVTEIATLPVSAMKVKPWPVFHSPLKVRVIVKACPLLTTSSLPGYLSVW